MRTTLDIDDDVLAAAKDLAKAEGKTMGQVISELSRKALVAPTGMGFAEGQSGFGTDDWPTFPARGGPPVSTDLIRRIEDDLDREDIVPWDHERSAPRIFDETSGAITAKRKPRKR